MKPFMSEDFLLDTDAAKELYHKHAGRMPIIDYHCHIDPADIAADRRYENITDLWLGGDHYKWRAMRCNGVNEQDITGSLKSDPYKVFSQWAATLPNLPGNPLYHWTYLELKRYFGIEEPLDPTSSRQIFDDCNRKLQSPAMSARGIIRQSGVELICTTDDPADSLEYHRAIATDPACEFRVLPAFRPDKAMNIDKPGFADYLQRLGAVAGQPIRTFDDLCQVLSARIDHFHMHGCRTSDHGLDACVFALPDEGLLDRILTGALDGEAPAQNEADAFKTAVLRHLAGQYTQKGWVMQIHYGAIRNNSSRMFSLLGPDSGYDSAGDGGGARALSGLLNTLEADGNLPRTVLYSLNPGDNEMLLTLAGCFQTDGDGSSRVQLGSAWWFNDHQSGIRKQLSDYASLGALGRFIGMTTDSRSFLSYTRHEYFRRILCSLIGGWAENGEIIDSLSSLGSLTENISHHNAVSYFKF